MVFGDDKENRKAEVKRDSKIQEDQSMRELFKIIQEMSDLLGTGLDAETLRHCTRLCELGLNPEVLATIVVELQKEARHHRHKQRFATGNRENGAE